MSRNIVMLDLDDVLNPSRMRNPRKTGIVGYHKETFGPVRVWVSTDHGRLLGELDAQIVWATTWVDHPDLLAEYAAATEIEAGLPMIDFSEPTKNGCGKLNGVKRWLAENDAEDARLCWIDDALGGPDFHWAEERQAPTKLVAPKHYEGLTPAMYADIAAFLKGRDD